MAGAPVGPSLERLRASIAPSPASCRTRPTTLTRWIVCPQSVVPGNAHAGPRRLAPRGARRRRLPAPAHMKRRSVARPRSPLAVPARRRPRPRRTGAASTSRTAPRATAPPRGRARRRTGAAHRAAGARRARRCAASARSPPTSTCAPATCRSATRTTQPRREHAARSRDAQIRALVALRRLARGGPPVPQPHPERGQPRATGLTLFTEHCAGCHQVVGAGGIVTGASAPPLDTATRDADRRGGAHRAVPDAALLASTTSPTAQLDSLVRYVLYTKHPDDAGGWAIGHLGPCPGGDGRVAPRGRGARCSSRG